MFHANKTFGHELGLSTCFRQWRAAHSHCRFLHGYALSVRLCFQASAPDSRGWVVDFGALKPLKVKLEDLLDHKTLIAGDDPELAHFMDMYMRGLIDLRVLPNGVGCENFARHIYGMTEEFLAKDYIKWLRDSGVTPPQGLALQYCEVGEHYSNAAHYAPKVPRILTALGNTNLDD